MSPPSLAAEGHSVLAVLRAFITGRRTCDGSTLTPAAIGQALHRGLGPIVAHVAGGASCSCVLPDAEKIRAAELTARVLTADRYSALSDLLAVARDVECPVVLLKGTATALQYYPAPHLRTTGDIDVLVPAEFHAVFEARLRASGLRQSSSLPPTAFEGRHHSMPFWHPARSVWIDVHSQLFPRQYPLARDRRFSWPAIAPQLSPIAIGGQTAYVMNHELQLVYTSARWAERFDSRRGIFPMLDVALLIGKHEGTLDWERMLASVHGSWASTALHLMLSWLHRYGLARVPLNVRGTLAASERHVNRLSIGLLHRLITAYVAEGRSFGFAPAEWHVQWVWADLLAPRSPTANLLCVPYHLACPPHHPERFSPRFAMRRLESFARRAAGGHGN